VQVPVFRRDANCERAPAATGHQRSPITEITRFSHHNIDVELGFRLRRVGEALVVVAVLNWHVQWRCIQVRVLAWWLLRPRSRPHLYLEHFLLVLGLACVAVIMVAEVVEHLCLGEQGLQL